MTELGQLQKVELRNAWQTEDQDFTPWLAEEPNLKILADTINLDLELEAVEKNVGPFRADILCKDTHNDSWVLIENQLERTDHRHLGQLMTYAAGLKAATIVWIADKFCDEHRAAMDWLNQITSDDFNFFGLEIELWRIDNSNPAPKFNVIAKPNDWSRSVSQASNKIAANVDSPLKQLQQEYWMYFNQYLANNNSFIKSRKARPKHWYDFAIGKGWCNLCITINSRENKIGVQFYISGDRAKDYFYLLSKQKEKIEDDIGQALEWDNLPNSKSSKIIIFNDSHFDNKDEWEQDMLWFKDNLEKFDQVFRPIIKNLDLSDIDIDLEATE